jgi:flagellar protein FlgJ
VQGEVVDFIEHGALAGADARLGSQAQAYLARIRGGAAADAAAVVDAAGVAGSATATSAARQQFLAQIAPWSAATASRLGVAPEILSAHAALESGWGQHPIRQADGSDSYNLFGIKAGASWQGDTASVTTTEFENGVAQKKTERFRSYADPGEAFGDFARLLEGRYPASLNSGNNASAYAQGLVRGGYASDPAYAAKLTRLAASLQSGG